MDRSEPRQLPELKEVTNLRLVQPTLLQEGNVNALDARLEVVTQTLRDHAPEPLADMPLALRMEESVGSLLLRASNPELFATAYRGVLETVLVQKLADQRVDPDVIQQLAQLMQLAVTPRLVVDSVRSVPVR